MSYSNCVSALRCNLCRNGLIAAYDVYQRGTDASGVPGEPVFLDVTNGYLFSKNTRHMAEFLEIAGDLPQRGRRDFRLLVFDDVAQPDDLILIGGIFYRVDAVTDILSLCRVLDLEEDSYAAQD